MDTLNYEQENAKEHVEIGKVCYQDSKKGQMFMAWLELFGNGYDINVFVDDAPNYVLNCVVSNTSYELLQRSEEEDALIVRVNDNLFVMTEKQFELIKNYYDQRTSILPSKA